MDKRIPNGLQQIGKIYIIDYDNGEPYEDGAHYVYGVFQSREAAEKCLKDIGAIKDSRYGTWSSPDYVCSMGNMDCEECPKFGNEYECCEEYDRRLESEWDCSYYTIEEYDLLDIV